MSNIYRVFSGSPLVEGHFHTSKDFSMDSTPPLTRSEPKVELTSEQKRQNSVFLGILCNSIEALVSWNEEQGIVNSPSVFDLQCKPSETVDLRTYLKRVAKYCNVPATSYIIAMIYLRRINIGSTTTGIRLPITAQNQHKLAGLAFFTAFKYLQDTPYNNDYLAKVAGVDLQTFNSLEVSLLERLGWQTSVVDEEFTLVSDAFLAEKNVDLITPFVHSSQLQKEKEGPNHSHTMIDGVGMSQSGSGSGGDVGVSEGEVEGDGDATMSTRVEEAEEEAESAVSVSIVHQPQHQMQGEGEAGGGGSVMHMDMHMDDGSHEERDAAQSRMGMGYKPKRLMKHDKSAFRVVKKHELRRAMSEGVFLGLKLAPDGE